MGRFTILLLAVALSFAGIAISAQGGGSSKVTLCAVKKGGDLSLGSKGKCSKGEKKVVIAKQGPAGEQGPQGAPGTTASIQPENPIAVGPNRADCAAAAGNYCGPPNCVGTWHGNASFQKDAMGFVHLRGNAGFATGGTCGANAPGIFYLPARYRPEDTARTFAVASCIEYPNDFQRVVVETDGLVRALGGVSSCIALDTISFHP